MALRGRSARPRHGPPGETDLRRLQEELSLAAGHAPDATRALLTMLRKLCAVFEWDFGEAWVPSRDGSVLKPGPAWPRANPSYLGYRVASRRLGFLPGGGLVGRVWRDREPAWMDDLSEVSNTLFTRGEAAREAGFRSALALPLLAGDELVTVLVLYRLRPGPPRGGELKSLVSALAPIGPGVARKRIEVELAVRERQQKAVARLGLHALSDAADLDTFMLAAVRVAADTLGVGHAKFVEPRDGGRRLRVRAGFGWREGVTGRAEVPAGRGSQSGFTLESGASVIVPDLDREERFRASPLVIEHGIVSGLSVLVHGHKGPLGVLAVHGRQRRSFTGDDVHFLQAVANVLGTTIERVGSENELSRHRRHLETLVAERTRQLEASHQRLRMAERLASIGTLAAGLGHDLGNTVLPLLCRLDSLESAQLSLAAREDLAAVRNAVEYLRQLSRGLRLFARDPDDASAVPGVTPLRDWWICVSPLLRAALPARVELECDIAPGLPPVAVPAHRLSQAVLNLVSNAAEAIEGEGRVRVEAALDEERLGLRLEVSDTGRGMSEDVLSRSLDPFFTTKKRGLSTGLGLAMVHALAESCGGAVEIESEEGRGTRVRLLLPAADEETDTSDGAQPPEPAVTASVSLRDPRLASYAELLLRSSGMEAVLRPESGPPDTRVWITDPSPETVGAARQFLAEDSRRRVVFIGDLPTDTREPRFVVVDRRGGPDAMRRSLRQVVFQLLEASA